MLIELELLELLVLQLMRVVGCGGGVANKDGGSHTHLMEVLELHTQEELVVRVVAMVSVW
jgi:hypothetical protein